MWDVLSGRIFSVPYSGGVSKIEAAYPGLGEVDASVHRPLGGGLESAFQDPSPRLHEHYVLRPQERIVEAGRGDKDVSPSFVRALTFPEVPITRPEASIRRAIRATSTHKT